MSGVQDNVHPDDNGMRRVRFVEMTERDQVAFLDGIRERRLRAVAVYKEAQAAKRVARDERLAAQLEQASKMMDKELAALDKALEKVEARRVKMIALTQIINQENE